MSQLYLAEMVMVHILLAVAAVAVVASKHVKWTPQSEVSRLNISLTLGTAMNILYRAQFEARAAADAVDTKCMFSN